jgi:hypothetical protein
VHQVRDWFSGTAAYFGWMREAKRENTRCGLRPMSDKAASQKTRSPEGCDENGPAAALLLSHVSIQICSFVLPVRLGPPCRRPILIATPLNQSRTWCTKRATPDGALQAACWISETPPWFVNGRYEDENAEQLIASIKENVLGPAEAKVKELRPRG